MNEKSIIDGVKYKKMRDRLLKRNAYDDLDLLGDVIFEAYKFGMNQMREIYKESK